MKSSQFKLIFLFSIWAAFSGCASQNVSQDVTLKENEGVFITRIVCGTRINGVLIHKSGNGKVGYMGKLKTAAAISCKNGGIRSFKVPAGKYYISQIIGIASAHLEYPEEEAYSFEVKEDSLTYIGDIRITTSSSLSPIIVKLTILDWIGGFKPHYAKQKNNLLDKYPLIKNIAKKS